jgi:glutathione S-transferase
VALKIFHAPGSRSLRVIWLAEEMGLDYELIGETFGRASPELIAANPARALPALIDGDVAMSESIAIMQYLAATYGPTPLAPMAGDPGFPAYLQYLVYGEASLSAFLNPLIGTKLLAPADQKDNFTAGLCRTVFRRRVSALVGRLTQSPHLAGEAFTAADISVGYALGLAEQVNLASDYPAPVADYWARLKLRPAFQRAAAR